MAASFRPVVSPYNASATAAGSPGRGLTHRRPSPTCGARAARLVFGSYAGSVTPVSTGGVTAGGGAARGGVGSRRDDTVAGPDRLQYDVVRPAPGRLPVHREEQNHGDDVQRGGDQPRAPDRRTPNLAVKQWRAPFPTAPRPR